MRRLILAAAFAAGSMFAFTGSAMAACPGTTVDIGGLAYVNDDQGVWIYLESNNEPGLQRGGSNLAGEPEICADSDTPDTLLV